MCSIPVGADVTEQFPVGALEIRTADPYYVFCAQGNHCQQGMVFAVNAGDTFAAFQAAATGAAASTSTAPPTSTTGVVTVTATVTVGSGGQVITTTYGSYPGSAQPTAASAQEHVIVVGGPNGDLTYKPSNITAQVGDTITFQFRQKNHTATQSSFGQPCRPLAQTSTNGQTGFVSGFQPVSDDATTFPTFSIRVNDVSVFYLPDTQSTHFTAF